MNSVTNNLVADSLPDSPETRPILWTTRETWSSRGSKNVVGDRDGLDSPDRDYCQSAS